MKIREFTWAISEVINTDNSSSQLLTLSNVLNKMFATSLKWKVFLLISLVWSYKMWRKGFWRVDVAGNLFLRKYKTSKPFLYLYICIYYAYYVWIRYRFTTSFAKIACQEVLHLYPTNFQRQKNTDFRFHFEVHSDSEELIETCSLSLVSVSL